MRKQKLFDLVKAWNDDKNDFVVGCYIEKEKGRHLVHIDVGRARYTHAVKITHELEEQLKKLDEVV